MATLDHAHALLIGIADYQHIRTLPPVKDAQDLAALLIDPQHCGYPAEQVHCLMDAAATQAAIRQMLAELAARSHKDATVLIYFSGHGGRITTGAHTGEYLLPVDADAQSDERLAHTAISGPEFTAALQKIQARQLVVIFDCCHAGGIGQPRDLVAMPFETGLSERYYEALTRGRGRVILASSRDSEYSYVFDGADYGLFTKHLLAGLRGGVASEDGLIRIFDLFKYVHPRVTAEHNSQHPTFKADLEENFAIALYQGGQIGIVPKDEQGFRYDAYISYAAADSDWVQTTLAPRLQAAGLRIAISGYSDEPGVDVVVGAERGIEQAKRTIIVLSDAYLADHMATFQNVMGQTMGIQEGQYRLLPLRIAPLTTPVPMRLKMLATLNFAESQRIEAEFERLIRALHGPLPQM